MKNAGVRRGTDTEKDRRERIRIDMLIIGLRVIVYEKLLPSRAIVDISGNIIVDDIYCC